MAKRAGKAQELCAQRGRREDLRGLCEPTARDLRTPSEAAVRGVDRVEVATLRVEHLSLAVGRAGTLISPAADDRVDADMIVGLGQLGRCRGVRESERRVERTLRLAV